jgi:prepilin-type N-terminal cleavage/methylation domain-containing protein
MKANNKSNQCSVFSVQKRALSLECGDVISGARTFLSAAAFEQQSTPKCPMPLGIRDPHPGGMADNSPTFQRWDHDRGEPSPEGTPETYSRQPSLRDSSSGTSNPTLKRWAIIVCPSGTERASSLSNPSGCGQECPRSASAFTLIELLVVIAIIGLLSGLVVGLLPLASTWKVRHRVRAELAQVETAIESYKAKRGFYPPDNTNNFTRSSLYYELLGTTLNNGTYTTLNGDGTIAASDVSPAFDMTVSGFINCNAVAEDAQNFFQNVRGSQLMTNASGVKFLGVLTKGPSGNFSPWGYNSSSPVHNPETFDVWVDVIVNGKTNTFGNWKQD